jgi:hypothetical protein
LSKLLGWQSVAGSGQLAGTEGSPAQAANPPTAPADCRLGDGWEMRYFPGAFLLKLQGLDKPLTGKGPCWMLWRHLPDRVQFAHVTLTRRGKQHEWVPSEN